MLDTLQIDRIAIFASLFVIDEGVLLQIGDKVEM